MENEAKMPYFTPEIIEKIILKTPINTVLNSKFVSQTWGGIVNDPRFAYKHLMVQKSQNQHCCFLLQSTKDNNPKLFAIPDLEVPNLVKLDNMPFASLVPPSYKIVGSCDGIVCLVHSQIYGNIVVCNPVIGDYMVVPESPYVFDGPDNYVTYYGFGRDKGNINYKVVRMIYKLYSNSLDVEVHHIGTDSWKLKNWRFPFGSRCPFGVHHNGALHWLGHYFGSPLLPISHVIRFDLEGEKFVDVIPVPQSVYNVPENYAHLGVLDDCLYVCNDYPKGYADVWLLKDYNKKDDSWTVKYHIKSPVKFGRCQLSRFRPLCVLLSGEILLECDGLYTYEPNSQTLKEVGLPGLPISFETFVHVPSLVALKDAITLKELPEEDNI